MPEPFKILLASEYFERRIKSIEADRAQQTSRVDKVFEFQHASIMQKHGDLDAMLPKVQTGHWVSFHVLIPEGPYNATEGTETISGVVMQVRNHFEGDGRTLIDKLVQIKVESNPANVKLHGIDHGTLQWVSVKCLSEISKAIPRGETGPSGAPIRDFIQPAGGVV